MYCSHGMFLDVVRVRAVAQAELHRTEQNIIETKTSKTDFLQGCKQNILILLSHILHLRNINSVILFELELYSLLAKVNVNGIRLCFIQWISLKHATFLIPISSPKWRYYNNHMWIKQQSIRVLGKGPVMFIIHWSLGFWNHSVCSAFINCLYLYHSILAQIEQAIQYIQFRANMYNLREKSNYPSLLLNSHSCALFCRLLSVKGVCMLNPVEVSLAGHDRCF